MTDTNVVESSVRAKLEQLEQTSVLGLAWGSVKNTVALASVATELAVVIGVSEAQLAKHTYISTRLANMDKPKTNSFF